jgi:hypothetical protein
VPITMDDQDLEPTTQRRRRRRGLLVFLLVGSSVATFGAGLMSLALFTDSDASTGGFTTGTIDIASTPTALFSVTAMMPGDSQSASLDVANNGTAELRYALTSSSTNTDLKDLRSQLQLTVKEGACPSVGTTVYSGVLDSAAWGSTTAGFQAGDRVLAASTSEDFCFTVSLPSGTLNPFQGATTTTTFTFSAEQTANN